MIPESQDAKPLGLQPCGALCIRDDLLPVLSSIDFDDQLPLKAYKINDVSAQHLLPSKLVSLQLSHAKVLP